MLQTAAINSWEAKKHLNIFEESREMGKSDYKFMYLYQVIPKGFMDSYTIPIRRGFCYLGWLI